jgi:phosphoribosylpyrophosphate synthetase
MGVSHIWYTGLLEHATQTDYTTYGISLDHPAMVKGCAGSPYAIKDYYDIDPDLASVPDRRFKEFSNIICERTGAVNGFSHVQVFGHRRKAHIDHVHELADNAEEYIHVDGDFFRGRKVIVLDDIVTTCKTANAFIDRMASAGADVSMVLFLAKTKQFKRKSN